MPEIAPTGSAPATPERTPAGGLGDLDSDAFLRLFVAQLRYQNPMEPADHTAMLQQTAQFTQVEALQHLTRAQQDILATQQAAHAAGLVGREVTARGDEGEDIVGVVHGTRLTADGPLLLLAEEELPLDRVKEVRPADGDAPA